MKYDTRYETSDQIVRDANDIQSACNPLAVCNAIADAIRYHLNNSGMDQARSCPYVRCMIGKLADLHLLSHDGEIYSALSKPDSVYSDSIQE